MSLPETRNNDGGLTRTVIQVSDVANADVPPPSRENVPAVFVITTAGPFPPKANHQAEKPPWMYTIPEFDEDDELYEQFRRSIQSRRERYSDDEEVLP